MTAVCLFRPGGGRALSAPVAGSGGVKVAEYRRVSELRGVFDRFFGARHDVE